MEWLDEEQHYWDEQRAYYGEVAYESVAKLIEAVRVSERNLKHIADVVLCDASYAKLIHEIAVTATEALAQLQSGEFGGDES